MSSIIQSLNSPWLTTLGYTLLHSLWQAAIITIIVIMVIRFIPTKLSNIRYVIASLGLFFMMLLSVATFLHLSAPSNEVVSASTQPYGEQFRPIKTTAPGMFTTYAGEISLTIESAMPVFLLTWIVGTLLFSLRIFMGLAYLERLRNESVLQNNEWSACLQRLAVRLDIKRFVLLAESSAVRAPVVIGYFKPIILIPVGMCSGLSSAQLETIFLHELMHIRRKDYLINLIQAFVEAIYFFNPSVWIISEIIKREREHCCDDAVVQLHGDATEYARALATLEEIRLSKVGLSLSLAENKNELLIRIRRLMEKSVKNYYGREKIVPALLLVIGLICASWMSTQTGRNELALNRANEQEIVSDTTKKDKKNKTIKEAKTSKQKKSAADLQSNTDGDAEEQIESDIDVDNEKYSGMPVPLPDLYIPMPPLPDIGATMPPIPELESMIQDFRDPSFDWDDENNWKEFSKEFEENFKSKFEDFYEKHEKDIQKMMEEVQEKMTNKFGDDWSAKMQDFAARNEERAVRQAETLAQRAEELSTRHKDQLERSREALETIGRKATGSSGRI